MVGVISATSLFSTGDEEDCSDYEESVSELLRMRGVTVGLTTVAGWVRPVNEVSLATRIAVMRAGGA